MKKIPFSFENNLLTGRLLPVSAISLALAVSGCASTNTFPKKLEFERTPQADATSILGEEQVQRKYAETDTPAIPAIRTGSASKETQQISSIADEKSDLTVSFNQMPIPTFIHAIYGSVLKANYSMDAAVASRTDLVTFRTPKPQTAPQMANLARLLLKSYGIAVQDFGGAIRIVPENASSSYSPQIKRGRAQPDTPASLRPIFHYVELEAVRVSDFSGFMRTMFGSKIQMTEDAPRNALLLSGQPEDVAAALEIVEVFDQPAMRGQRSKRVTPAFWTANEFSQKLSEVLTAEGYSVGASATAGTPIILLPIAPLNSVIIFASSENVMDHVLKWTKELDRPSESQAGGTYFTYPVKYADAQALAATLSDLINPSGAAVAAPAATPGTAGTTAAVRRSSRIVVNNATNSLIIQGAGASEYRQWMTLLSELDKPTKSALIEVTVAEVTLKASKALGVDWGFREGVTRPAGVNGVVTRATAGTGGLTVNLLNGAGLLRAQLSALAADNKARILSSPKIMARNGEVATIQVGDEVPILTSTTTTPGAIAAPGGSTVNTVTNTVQYRSTGVILKVRPVINSGNRIDLDVTQEVSIPTVTKTGVSSSPTISTRRVDTKLSLRDGSSIMLAGLIQNNDSRGDSGVPLLKDIPGLGNLFKSSEELDNRTELIIMITPYIINDDFEAEAITSAFQNTLGDWAKDLRERTEAGRLKRSDAIAPVQAMNRPNDNAAQTPAQKNDAKAPAATPSAKTAPASDAKSEVLAPPAAKDDKDAAESSGVIMSKPEPPPASVTKAAPDKTPDNKTGGKATNQGATKAPPPPGSGKPVEDAKLLEELRRAVEKR